MCQLCAIRDFASRDRWPKPLEGYVQEILGLLPTAHKEANNYAAQQSTQRKSKSQADPSASVTQNTTPALISARHSLVQTLDMLDTLFKLLSEARVEWWNSPAKKQQRREWSDCGDTEKLTQLQKVNQKCIDMVADMVALVGRFRKWSLDVADESSSEQAATASKPR